MLKFNFKKFLKVNLFKHNFLLYKNMLIIKTLVNILQKFTRTRAWKNAIINSTILNNTWQTHLEEDKNWKFFKTGVNI